MKSITVKFFKSIISTMIMIGLVIPLAGKVRVKDLPEKYRRWLTEEVVYIITPTEKKVFLELESSRERDLFIEAFWKNRDPNPNTTENEFKSEHYGRIQYANKHYGRGTPTKGWRTEMGRIYIILGLPNSIDRYENLSEVYPTIVWFYQGMVKYGLPNAFNVVFFKQEGSGDYILYSPIKHGPQKLLVHYYNDPRNYLGAYDELRNIDPNIARISLSLIEGEQRTVTAPSIASEILLSQKIVETPRKKVNDTYASKLLKYKKYVQSDYSINYIDNSNMLTVSRDAKSGIAFVHYLLEPKKLTLEQYDNTFYANLEINGNVVDAQENTIYQFNRKVPIRLEREQLEKIQAKLFSFQAFFPLIEGQYTLNLLFRNTVSKEFSSIEKEIIVPALDPSKPRLGSLILANRIKKTARGVEMEKPWVFDGNQLVPSPRNDFSKEDALYLYYQIHGLSPGKQEKGHITYTIFKDQEKVLDRNRQLGDYSNKTHILEKFSLQDFKPAYYSIKVTLYGSDALSLAMQEANFYISPLSNLARPWVVSLSNEADSAVTFNTIGNQYLNKKEYKKAYIYLERAYNLNPISPKITMDFSKILLLAKKYQKIKQIATPFLNSEHKNTFLGILGQAAEGMGQYEEAIKHYKDFLEYYGTNINILNTIGKCYVRLGNVEEALVAWKKSLELEPNQEKLKARVKSLKTSKTKQGESGQ